MNVAENLRSRSWPGTVVYSADDETPDTMIHPDTMRFLSEFVAALLQSVNSIDSRVLLANPDRRKCLSGIVSRGVYRGEFSIVFRVSNDSKATATYFVMVRPGGCYSGGGSRTPLTSLARLLRQQMMTDTGRWRDIVEGPTFQKFFPHGLSDGVTTTASKRFAKNHDAMDSLNLRGVGACRPHTDQLMQSGEAISEIVRSFTASRQLVDFINRATTK